MTAPSFMRWCTISVPIDVDDHGTVVGRHRNVHAADGSGVSDSEGGARVGGRQAGLGCAGSEAWCPVGCAVADGCGAAAPESSYESGPVLGAASGRPVTRPEWRRPQRDGEVGRLAVGVDCGQAMGQRRLAGRRGDGAHEKRLLPPGAR